MPGACNVNPLRLLIATEFPPNASGGGPAVVRQMLKGWPTENLYWWSCLPEKDHRFGQTVASHGVAAIPTRFYPNQRASRLKAWLMENLWAQRASKHLGKTIRDWSPHVIWAIPHLWAILPLSSVLPIGKTGFHTTVQDYPDCHSQEDRLGASRALRLAALSDLIYSSATTRDATSRPMLEDLAARTGRSGRQMLHSGIERSDLEWLKVNIKETSTEIRVAHAGTIIVEKEFDLFVRALKSVRSKINLPITLHLYGNHSYKSRPWFDSTWIYEHGNLTEPQLQKELRNCTWGFAPMALTDHDPRYNRFSFPTKFITYLAAGLPIISMGHPESSIIRTATKYVVGPCITNGESEGIQNCLFTEFRVKNPSSRYRPAIIECAQHEFDAAKMRANLYESLRICSSRSITQ